MSFRCGYCEFDQHTKCTGFRRTKQDEVCACHERGHRNPSIADLPSCCETSLRRIEPKVFVEGLEVPCLYCHDYLRIVEGAWKAFPGTFTEPRGIPDSIPCDRDDCKTMAHLDEARSNTLFYQCYRKHVTLRERSAFV